METKAVLRNLRVAPRKVRLLIDMVRGMNANQAIAHLRFSQKNAAVPVRKLIESAIANAIHNHSLKEESLVVERAFVDEGPTLKRWRPRAFGRASAIRKRTSHVTIVLKGAVDQALAKKKLEEQEKAEKKKAAAAKKAEEKKDAPKKPKKKPAAKKTEKKAAKKKDA